MGRTFLDHVDLRVESFERSLPLYDALFLALGMGRIWRSERWVGYGYAEVEVPFFAITEEAGHRGNHNRIAFAAETKETVDLVGQAIRAAGGQGIEGPEFCPEYHAGYYAVFFEDGDGNRFEVCCHSAQG
jgi:catechol 2,3-dioxygenase-like lactoylglutathione lyase family enzyme